MQSYETQLEEILYQNPSAVAISQRRSFARLAKAS